MRQSELLVTRRLPGRLTPRSEAGISLVEVLVALLLMTVALMSLATGFAPSRMVIQTGSEVTTASNLARQTMEQMRNVEYSSDTDNITTANFPAQAYGAITGFPGFRRAVTITTDSPVTGTKTVSVTVFYKDSDGQERGVTLKTIFTQST